MSDEVAELKQKLAEIERKTAIWRSMVAVLLLVFLAGWIASFLWMKARLEARVEKVEKAFAEKRKTIEAESFVVRDASGKKWASFGVGLMTTRKEAAVLNLYDTDGVERIRASSGGVALFTPEKNLGVFLLVNEHQSGLFLVNRDGKTSAFSAFIDEKGYSMNSEKPIGRDTIDFSQLKGGTVTP